METGKFYLSKTGESFRCLEVTSEETKASLFESDYVLNGPTQKMKGFMAATEMREIDEQDYKLRVVAMRAFQDQKNDKDYPFKESYLGQYEEMKGFMSKDAIESFFEIGGGFRSYDEAAE